MKIAIVAPSSVPFVIGGAENFWWGLVDALNARVGVQAELLKLPSPERDMGDLLMSYRRFFELDVSHFDLVISSKYPAWAIRHPNHIVYMQHTLRGLYDCYPEILPKGFDPNTLAALGISFRIVDALANIRPADIQMEEVLDALDSAFRRAPSSACWAFPGPVTRAVIQLLDAIALRPDKIVHYAAISQVVATRAGYFPTGVKVAVHHHPTNLKGLVRGGAQQTIFSASRLDPAKRIDLIIDAYIRSGLEVPLHIAGSGSDEARLRAAAGNHPGIRFLGRIPDAQLVREYARAICVPFVPCDEDYGLVTLEAMLAAKPVITTIDSGGPTELIEHGRTGLIVKPDVSSLAIAMRQLCDDRATALQMGVAAQGDGARPNWDTLCDALLSTNRPLRTSSDPCQAGTAGASTVVTRRAKPLLGVLNTYPIAPVNSGGKLRLHGLYSHLAEHFQIRFVNLAPSHFSRAVRNLGADFTEELVPKSHAFADEEQRLQALLGASVEDLTAALHPSSAPEWLDAIDMLARHADLMVCSHPYAVPALREVSSAAFVYEAHNVEIDLKAGIYGNHKWAIDRVRELERRAVVDAALVTACSIRDLERFRELYERANDGKFAVVPNGIDLLRTPFRDSASAARRRTMLGVKQPLALFMGSAHGPNIDGARLVIEAARHLPRVHFLLLGSVCSAVGEWERPANVGLAGVVSDAEKSCWLAISDIGLNPVISGSGTNLKLIEYAAAGVPVVSTDFGARGIGFSAGREYVLATAGAFAEGIKTLLGQAGGKRESMARNARRLIEANSDWSPIAAAYATALKECMRK